MSFFKESTQAKNWIKTSTELEEASKHKVKTIIKRIKEINEKIKKAIEGNANNQQAPIENSINNQDPNANPQKNNEVEKSLIKYNKLITPKEENLLVIYFTNQIMKIINSNIKSLSLKTYALSYFRRFYLKKAIVDYDPEYMLCAAIFLGGKVAQLNINFNKMGELIPFLNEEVQNSKKSNKKLLLGYEFYLCIILNYEFYVFCPYKAMLGFIYELDSKHFFDSLKTKEQFQKECEATIDQTFLSDLIFTYNYSYIALASIFIVGVSFNFDNDKIINTLELKQLIDIKKFLNEYLVDIKNNLEQIKIIEKNEFLEYTKKVIIFNKKYPQYAEKLEEERNILLKKMESFEKAFEGRIYLSNGTEINNNYKINDNNEMQRINYEQQLLNNKRERNEVQNDNNNNNNNNNVNKMIID